MGAQPATITATTYLRPVRSSLTVDDYMAMPDNGRRYELLYGELMMSPSYFHGHGRVSGFIYRKLDEFVEARSLGYVGLETDVILAKDVVVRPDVHFISKRRASIIRGHIYGPPELVVEVTSPNNWQYDLMDKLKTYERFGVREYWAFDIAMAQDRAFLYFMKNCRFHGGVVDGPILESHVLRGFSLNLEDVWKRASDTVGRRERMNPGDKDRK